MKPSYKSQIALTSILLVALCASASIVEDMQNPELTVRSAVERAVSASTDVQSILTTGFEVLPGKVREVVTSVVAAKPADIQEIVETSLRSGVPAQVIADQCRNALTLPQVKTLVRTAIRESARPETILETCLPAVAAEDAPGIVAAALEASDPGMIDRVIASAYDTLQTTDSDAEYLVARGMVEARLVVGTEVIDEPLAIRMLQNLRGVESEQVVLQRREAEALVLRVTEGEASAN